MRSLFPSHGELVAKVMDMQLERQNIVMSNLANMRTPGYKALRLEFEEDLQAAMDRDSKGMLSKTHPGHSPANFDPETFKGDFYKTFTPHVVKGMDRVDMDKEMAIMSKNNMMYNALTTVLKRQFDGMTKAIQEGGK